MDSKVLFLFALIPIIVSEAHANKNGHCCKNKQFPDGSVDLKNEKNCYWFSTEKTTWHVARLKCQEMGGFLAIIKDKRESDAITQYLSETLVPKNQDKTRDFWIGLQDIAAEGYYKWDPTNELVTSPSERSVMFQNWEDGEPNSFGPSTSKREDADCVRLNNKDSRTPDIWKWADWDCGETFFYLCEFRPGNSFKCNAN